MLNAQGVTIHYLDPWRTVPLDPEETTWMSVIEQRFPPHAEFVLSRTFLEFRFDEGQTCLWVRAGDAHPVEWRRGEVHFVPGSVRIADAEPYGR